MIPLALAALIAGVWGGLARMSWQWEPLHANWISFHGPLMVSGFLGTVIGLERAVAMSSIWPFSAPLLTGLGAGFFIIGFLGKTGPMLIALGSLVFTIICIVNLVRQPALFTLTMGLGALCWLGGNTLWWRGYWDSQSIPQSVPWWSAFLVLTIAGERLELSRVLFLSRRARVTFLAAVMLLCTGCLVSLKYFSAGVRIEAAAFLGLTVWLLVCDVARRTVRERGLTRFIAVCLLSGYFWLGVSGMLSLVCGALTEGLVYDAALHSFFLGFIFAMIFGHAPVVFPSVSGIQMAFRPAFYVHLGMLQVSLFIRLAGDLAGIGPVRRWGGLLNGIAILAFFVNMALAARQAKRAKALGASRPGLLSPS